MADSSIPVPFIPQPSRKKRQRELRRSVRDLPVSLSPVDEDPVHVPAPRSATSATDSRFLEHQTGFRRGRRSAARGQSSRAKVIHSKPSPSISKVWRLAIGGAALSESPGARFNEDSPPQHARSSSRESRTRVSSESSSDSSSDSSDIMLLDSRQNRADEVTDAIKQMNNMAGQASRSSDVARICSTDKKQKQVLNPGPARPPGMDQLSLVDQIDELLKKRKQPTPAPARARPRPRPQPQPQSQPQSQPRPPQPPHLRPVTLFSYPYISPTTIQRRPGFGPPEPTQQSPQGDSTQPTSVQQPTPATLAEQFPTGQPTQPPPPSQRVSTQGRFEFGPLRFSRQEWPREQVWPVVRVPPQILDESLDSPQQLRLKQLLQEQEEWLQSEEPQDQQQLEQHQQNFEQAIQEANLWPLVRSNPADAVQALQYITEGRCKVSGPPSIEPFVRSQSKNKAYTEEPAGDEQSKNEAKAEAPAGGEPSKNDTNAEAPAAHEDMATEGSCLSFFKKLFMRRRSKNAQHGEQESGEGGGGNS
ncbi:hypothetical protein V8C42DRAFT_45071 [Trichoderma barbatum]